MALPASGQISISQIVTEFGGSAPHSLSEYYRGGGLIPSSDSTANVPTSGLIRLSDFYGATNRIGVPDSFSGVFDASGTNSKNIASEFTTGADMSGVVVTASLGWSYTYSTQQGGSIRGMNRSISIYMNGVLIDTATAMWTDDGPAGTIVNVSSSASGSFSTTIPQSAIDARSGANDVWSMTESRSFAKGVSTTYSVSLA